MTEYLYQNFNVKPVVIVKHPISFISSLKRVNWWPSPSEIFDQPELIDDFFQEDLNFVNQQWPDQLSQSAAFWRSVYKVLWKQSQKYSDWHFITHENLSQYPVETFRNLYNLTDLPWSKRIEKKILNLTSSRVSSQARKGKVQDFKRNSADIFKHSLRQLDLEERKRVFDITQDIASQFYTKDSFAID
ncbi:MAG: hypothetical protein F6K11_24425 [Leptolyngbya sp. SIO3F4]|nr:hypothetical protein [Leptolyngbya sp. SIO3F4]